MRDAGVTRGDRALPARAANFVVVERAVEIGAHQIRFAVRRDLASLPFGLALTRSHGGDDGQRANHGDPSEGVHSLRLLAGSPPAGYRLRARPRVPQGFFCRLRPASTVDAKRPTYLAALA